jgi:uncharacterized protein (DUF433 family)
VEEILSEYPDLEASVEEILSEYPDLEADDIREALQYAAFLASEEVHPFAGSKA